MTGPSAVARWESARAELASVIACDDLDWKQAWLVNEAGDLLTALAAETVRADAAEKRATENAHDADLLLTRITGRLDSLAGGELAHTSRDYGRGVAQAVRELRAVLDGAP